MSWSLPQLFPYHYTLFPSTPFNSEVQGRIPSYPKEGGAAQSCEAGRQGWLRGRSQADPSFSCGKEPFACAQCSRASLEGSDVTCWGCHWWSRDEVPWGACGTQGDCPELRKFLLLLQTSSRKHQHHPGLAPASCHASQPCQWHCWHQRLGMGRPKPPSPPAPVLPIALAVLVSLFSSQFKPPLSAQLLFLCCLCHVPGPVLLCHLPQPLQAPPETFAVPLSNVRDLLSICPLPWFFLCVFLSSFYSPHKRF